MPVLFAASELNAFKTPGSASPVESTDGAYHRAAYSRSHVYCESSARYVQIDLGAGVAVTTGWFFGIVRPHSSTFDNDDADLIFQISSATQNYYRLRLTALNVAVLEAWDGVAWVALASGIAINAAAGAAVPWVIRWVTGAAGTLLFAVNGVAIYNGAAVTPAAGIRYVDLSTGDNDIGVHFSEIIVHDGDVNISVAAVETEAPTGNGVDSTDGSGAFGDIDEALTSDADAIQLTAAGQHRSFTSPARTGTLGTVIGVSVAARMSRGATGPQNAKFYLTIGGVRYYSPTFALALTPTGYQYTWATNPSTGLAWTPADANAAGLEWGIEAVA